MRGGAALATIALVATACADGPLGGGAPEETALSGRAVPETVDVAPLAASEIEVFLRDATLTRISDGQPFHLYLTASGGMVIGGTDTATGGTLRARGGWSVAPEGRLCIDWSQPWPGIVAGCYSVYRYDSDYVLEPRDGGAARRFTRRPGDAESLL